MTEAVYVAIITAISSVVINIITAIKTNKDNNLKQIKEITNDIKNKLNSNGDGTKMLLADKLKFLCQKSLNEGYVDYDNLRIIESMYKSYHELGGNGFMTDIVERVKQLPIKMEKE